MEEFPPLLIVADELTEVAFGPTVAESGEPEFHKKLLTVCVIPPIESNIRKEMLNKFFITSTFSIML
jgi:hypothetical protein